MSSFTEKPLTRRRWRVVVASIVQESNSFCATLSGLEHFRAGTYGFGPNALGSVTGTGTEMAGFVDVARTVDADVVPTLIAWASTGGPMRPDDRDVLVSQLIAGIGEAIRTGHVDGVLIALHGAWVAVDDDDLDGRVLARIRERVGDGVPVVATLDLHANVTERMARNANALVGYATYPHVDMRDTGRRAAHLLFDMLERRFQTRVVYRRVPMVVPPENCQTSGGPIELVKQFESSVGEVAGVRSTSTFLVQPWLDVAEIGCTIVAVVDGDLAPQVSREVGRRLDVAARALWDARASIRVPLVHPDEATEAALSRIRSTVLENAHVGANRLGPVLLVDSADSPSAGACGDSSTLIRALLARDTLPGPVLATVVDAPAAKLAAAADGTRVVVNLGGTLDPARFQPVRFAGRARRIEHSVVSFTGGVGDGLTADLGTAAVIEGDDGPDSVDGLHVLVMANPAPCYDPAIYLAAGLEPGKAAAVVVKSATNFRWTYRDIAAGWVYVDSPGAATPNLTSLPYRRIPRPLWPWDQSGDGAPKSARAGHDALRARAMAVLPGGVTAGARANAAFGHPFYVAGAYGSTVTDVAGRVMIDLVTSNGAALVGHAHPVVIESINRALASGAACAYDGPNQVDLAERLCAQIPAFERVRFTNSGTEATFYATRLARAATGRTRVVKFEGHFHGYNDILSFSMWPNPDPALSGPSDAPRPIVETAGLPPHAVDEVLVLPFNDLEAFRRAMTMVGDDVAAVILEPANFDAGCVLPLPGFLEAVREETQRRGIVLIFDEILSGYRTGLGGAQAYFGVTPDLATVGKALGGGIPISAFGGRADLMEHLTPVGKAVHTGTYNAHPVPVAAALGFLRIAEDPGFFPDVIGRSDRLVSGLRDAFAAAGMRVRVQSLGTRFAMYFGLDPSIAITTYRAAAAYDRAMQRAWCSEIASRGVYSTPVWHHGISSAHDDVDLLRITDAAYEAASAVVAVTG
jgi:glutamate-1-semialdehyde 2,1-aminomutase